MSRSDDQFDGRDRGAATGGPVSVALAPGAAAGAAPGGGLLKPGRSGAQVSTFPGEPAVSHGTRAAAAPVSEAVPPR